MSKSVVVFGRENPPCPFCIKMKDVLTRKGYTFEYKDVSNHQDEFEQLQVRTVPQCVVDGVNLGGFDNIMNILKELKS